MILNGLNILYAVTFECISIIRFHYKYKKKWKLTLKYSLKRTIKLGISCSFSILGGLTSKLIAGGIPFFLGISLGPFVTVVIGLVGGIAFGYLGKIISDKISDHLFGKDEFKLLSANLYLIYIPLKYRLKGNNPYLSWNKTHLCSNVKSYIIECIINGVDIAMRVINIPNDVFELQECLGYEIDEKQYLINDNDSETFEDMSTVDEEIVGKNKRLYNGKKFVGDLIIPYMGIGDNAFKVDFVIYGINQEIITDEDWTECMTKEKLIEVGFILSAY
jgi:hypothetical protein